MTGATALLTVAQALAAAVAKLATAGIADPRLDARVLTMAALEVTRETLLAHGEAPVAPHAAARLADFVTRRAGGEPVARILGHKEFWSLDFAVTADTLIPRPETETLIEAALALHPDRQAPLRLLDLGTGSGCLLLALLSELPHASGTGIDISPGAVAVAQGNAIKLGLATRARFVVADFTSDMPDSVPMQCDLILSNPPYIVDSDIDGLAREVARHEPRAALSGGQDGLDAYRALAPRIARRLAPQGHALLEIGQGQAAAVGAIMAAGGLQLLACHADLAGITRVLNLSRA